MRQVDHTTKFLWQNRLMILAATLLFAVSAVYWRDYWESVASRIASQIEYEDAALCTKFGFVVGARDERHKSCMSDLRDLRASHEEMIAASMP